MPTRRPAMPPRPPGIDPATAPRTWTFAAFALGWSSAQVARVVGRHPVTVRRWRVAARDAIARVA